MNQDDQEANIIETHDSGPIGNRPILKIEVFVLYLQFCATLLVSLSSFALGVTLLRETGSVTNYAINAFFSAFPTVVFSPIAGVLVDKIGRSNLAIIVGLTCVVSGSIPFIQTFDSKTLPYVLLSLSNSISAGALSVIVMSTPRLVTSGRVGVGSFLSKIQVSEQTARVLGPLIVIVLFPLSLAKIALVVVVLGVGTILVSIASIRSLKTSEIRSTNISTKNESKIINSSIASSIRLLRENMLLRFLAPYVALTTASIELVSIVLIPVVLSFGGERTLSIALSLANFGAVISSLILARQRPNWDRRRALFILLSVEILGAICICIESITNSPLVYTLALIIGFSALPFLLISSQIIWLEGIPNEHLGRVSGLQKLSSWVFVPLSYIIGPLIGTQIAKTDPRLEIEIFRMIALSSGLFVVVITIAFFVYSSQRLLTNPNAK
jgi:MFS transporter, DHA3 family, macrolide efflux protein